MIQMKRILSIIILIGLIGGALGFYFYQKPHPSMDRMKVDQETTSSAILDAYQSSEDQANATYLGKVITVEGTVQSVEDKEQKTIILKGNDLMSSVRCKMDGEIEHSKFSTIQPGSKIKIKGICTGYLMDVIIERCIIEA